MARGLFAFGLAVVPACADDGIVGEGLLGRAIPLVTGDPSTLPRLAFIDEGCPGAEARGGCDPSGERACSTMLVDTLAPLTTLAGDGSEPSFETECFELRAGSGVAAEVPTAQDLDDAVARFRFRNVPLVRAAGGTQDWTWFAGSAATGFVEPTGVLGGNLLRSFAIALRRPADAPPTVAFYTEFPGSEVDLANQGRAFLPLQFPGRLLGRDLGDRCQIGDDGCRTPGFDLVRGQPNVALEAARMVLDACVAAPPCGVRYQIDSLNPFDPGDCTQTIGPDADAICAQADDPQDGGLSASLVVATSVDDIVLFEDSAVRMFGPLDMLPACPGVTIDDRACLLGNDGVLALPGWPPAGTTTPLPRIKVRSVALVPGATRARDLNPCERVEVRRQALLDQCDRYVDAVGQLGDVRSTTPPYSAVADDEADGVSGDPANRSLVVLGEHVILDDDPDPDANRWIEAIVLPAAHPLPVSLRLDVSPEAIAPDGLVGGALLDGTATVLDYTDPNPSVRVSCFDPREATCMVAPDCRRDAEAACCHGLPLNLLVEFIVLADDERCCTALSASELGEIQEQGFCLGTQPP
jgi:hypothetical protein